MTIRTGGNIIAGGFTEELLQTKANLNLDNSTVITNCITSIPQDIKLELDNGTLTLKAGSKVYVPNGFEQDGTTPKFDVVNILSNISFTAPPSIPTSLYYNPMANTVDYLSVANEFSGPTWTPTTYSVWYDTTNNLCKLFTTNTSTPDRNVSLPIAIFNGDGTQITSIDQIFNSFGYIGSTVFALPGVKGLIPNGRNADGSLKNIATEVTSVQTYTYTDALPNTDIYAGINISGTIQLNGLRSYNEEENIIYNSVDQISVCEFAKYRNPSGKIVDFTLKTPFHSLNWNDKNTISGWAMPSNSKYIDLTLGASGTSYTAPANGWFSVQGRTTNSGGFIEIDNNAVSSICHTPVATGAFVFMPVSKNQPVTIYYNMFSLSHVRFVYAEGE